MRIALSCVALLLTGTAAFAVEIPAQTKIDSVTVFLRGAEVTRTGKVKIDKGEHTIVIADVPASAVPGSIRVEGKATGKLDIGSVDTRRAFLARADSEAADMERKRLETLLDGLRDQKMGLEALVQAGDTQKALIANLAQLPSRPSPPASAGALPEDWSRVLATIAQGTADASKVQIEANVKLRELDSLVSARGTQWPDRAPFLSSIIPQSGKLVDDISLVDGSVLANAPFKAAIEALRDRPARREVDRRFVFIDPKPGIRFGSTIVQPVIPDVFVRPAPDGSWIIELNSDTLPRVLVNQTYAATVNAARVNEADKSFLTNCLQNANWLTKSLEQRARTILKVASEIVRQQDGFLAHGVEHLRPLNLRTIADAIGMHESTVSRVTSNKYMATPRGLFEMKYFFTASIAAQAGGEAHSAEAVRFRIKQMIDQETPDGVLSDDAIVTRLKDANIDIARRTVAKYRESLRIPSSVERRREKSALAVQSA